jgi:photosystem II stability/assembly factor-like uncharacterized protein
MASFFIQTTEGYSWDNQPTRSVASLNGLYVFDRSRAIAVGARGTVLRTTNAGRGWRNIATPTKDHLYSITFAADDAKYGWAVGTYGSIITTSDGGMT